MRVLPIAFRTLAPELTEVVSEAEFGGVLAPVPLVDADFTRERYLPGTAGEVLLLRDLLAGAGLDAG